MRLPKWLKMVFAIPEGDKLAQVVERLKKGQCLACGKKHKYIRRGDCPKCRRVFRLTQKQLKTKRQQDEWEKEQIRKGKILSAYQCERLLFENPFGAIQQC